jgi:hypothetical protein
VENEKKKTISEKNLLLISIGRINVKKISQIGDDHWSLGGFLKKTALKTNLIQPASFELIFFCFQLHFL